MLITQDTKNKTRNLELDGGLESGDGGDDVVGVEELEEQVPAKKGGRTYCGRPLLVKNCKKSNAGPNRSTSYSLSKFDFTSFRMLEAPP